MMYRHKLLFWSLIALLLGFAGGYLFSSKFCKVTIVRRVEKEIVLNQTLRSLLTQNAFLVHDLIRSALFNLADKQAIENKLFKNQEDISNLLYAYYGNQSKELNTLFLENYSMLSKTLQPGLEHNQINNLKTELRSNNEKIATVLAQLNPEWAFSFDLLKAGFNEQTSLIIQEIEATLDSNWERASNLFDKLLQYQMQFADQLDKGITQQFPHKF